MNISVASPVVRLVKPAPSILGSGPRRIVDLDAVEANVHLIQRLSGADVMAVVKADGFGHGAVEVARAALRAGATWLGVATVDEAVALRRAGVAAPILAWLVDPWSDLETAVRLRITLSCANEETLAAVVAAAAGVGTAAGANAADVQLEIDTGMARGGASPERWAALCAEAARLEADGVIHVSGIWSHLAAAHRPEWSAVAEPQARFVAAVAEAWSAGLDPQHLHLANSAAALVHPRTRFTMVRVAAGLYGIEPVEERTFGLRQAQRVTSHVTQLRDVPASTPVSYGGGYVTDGPTRLALVVGGYADGLPRGLGHVAIGGRAFPVAGAVTMDQLVVDIGDADVELGAEVVLLGDGAAEPTLVDWADWGSTNPHDVLTSLGGRFVRSWQGRAARPTSGPPASGPPATGRATSSGRGSLA